MYVEFTYDRYGRRQRGKVSSITTEEEAQRYRRNMLPDEELYSAARECDCVAMARARREA